MSERNSTEPGSPGRAFWTSQTAATAIFVALAATLGFLLLSVPNVELVTFTVFASGVVLGRWRGALVGALAMAIYSGANPYGSGLGVPTMFAAQLLASAFAGLAGGMAAPLWRGSPARRGLPVVTGGIGLALTLVYQIGVIVGLAVMSPEFRTGAVAVLLSNAFFSSVHLVSNTIVFAVLAPAVIPRALRLAGARSAPLVLALAVALACSPPARADEGEFVPLEPAAADTAAASAASSDSPPDTTSVRPPVEPPPGGDVRAVRAQGRGAVHRLPGGVRSIGSGWAGHRVSVARGALPAAMTALTVRGRPASDWVEGGLDLIAAASPAPGVVAVPSGPDVSLWPVFTAEWSDASVGGPVGSCAPAAPCGHLGPAPLVVDMRPLRRPASVPFSRLTAAAGADGRSLVGAEFGRRFTGGLGLTGYYETDDGRAPAAGGRYGIDRAGGSFLADVRGGWTVELGGTRTELDRARPEPAGTFSVSREYVRTDMFVRGSSERVCLELFHTQSWLELGPPGPETIAEVDGVFARVRGAGPVDVVRVQLDRRAVSGTLLSDSQEEVGLLVEACEQFLVGTNTLSVTGGADALGGEVVPRARAAFAPDRSGPDDWRVEAALSGRHPTAVELALLPRPLPGADGAVTRIGGDRRVVPERALVLSASYTRHDVLAGAGARGEVARVLDPIVLEETGDALVTPANAGDEFAASLTVWASAGDTSRVSGGVDASLFGLDADGALASALPVPSATVRASVSAPLALFDGYVRTRIIAFVEYGSGLARGPWSGLLDDVRAPVSLALVGSAGSARFFVALDDVFESDGARIPAMEPAGRAFSAGFSWLFQD